MGKRPDQKSITVRKDIYEAAKKKATLLGISVSKFVTDCIQEVPV